jgi:WD40 repeat protein
MASVSGDGKIKMWDPVTADGVETLQGHISSFDSVAFSGDGKRLAKCVPHVSTIQIWDSVIAEYQQTLEKHSRGVHSVAFNQDGRKLASGSDVWKVFIWDPETGQCIQTLEGQPRR